MVSVLMKPFPQELKVMIQNRKEEKKDIGDNKTIDIIS